MRAPALFSRFILSAVGVVLVPLLAGPSLATSGAAPQAEAPIAGWEIVKTANPEGARDVTRTRIAERIMDEEPLTMRFVGIELGEERFLVCEINAFGEMDFSVWAVSEREMKRLAQAEDIEGRLSEIRRTCGAAVETVMKTS